MEPITTVAHRRYSAGYAYNQKLGYYAKTTENENYINGEQWIGVQHNGLPTPVFNIEKRIMDYKVAALSSQRVKAVYGIEGITQHGEIDESEIDENVLSEMELNDIAKLMSGNAEVLWEKQKMDSKIRRWLRDGFVTGDMCAHVYWDETVKTGQKAKGDIRTERVHGGNMFFGNPNEPNVQKQPWVIIKVRDTVDNLRAEAERRGVKKDELIRIGSDANTETQVGKYGQIEIDGDSSTQKTNAYIMYYKKDDGKVYWSKSTEGVEICKDIPTKLSRYPIAWGNWDEVENCFHGKAECAEIHPNQRFINKMFALCMVWFAHNAFGKTAYDATRITAWTNEIGVALPVQGPVDGVIQQLTAGNFNSAVLLIIDYAIKYTKEMQGATDAALGQERADNTSALIMMQKASALPLENQQARMYQFVEDIFLIWADFMANYYIVGRNVPVFDQDGKTVYKPFKPKDKDKLIMNAKIEVGASSYWSEISSIQTLDALLQQNRITLIQYLERMPNGYISGIKKLIEEQKAIAMAAPMPSEGVQTDAQPQNGGQPPQGMPQAQLEAEAAFFDGLPPEVQQQLMSMPPEEMEMEIQAMMNGAPQQY
jgi:hypothetical protein